jgi:hypothetical protein
MSTHETGRAADSDKVGLEVPIVYRFDTLAHLIEGWQSHVATQRIIHEEAARSLQTWHYRVGGAGAALAGLAGSSGVAAWQGTSSSAAWALATALVGTAAAICGGFTAFLDLGGRAQRHRAASVAYKRLLRELEARTTVADEQLADVSDGCAQEIIDLRKALAEVDAAAPIPPRRTAEAVHRRGRRCAHQVTYDEPAVASRSAATG